MGFTADNFQEGPADDDPGPRGLQQVMKFHRLSLECFARIQLLVQEAPLYQPRARARARARIQLLVQEAISAAISAAIYA